MSDFDRILERSAQLLDGPATDARISTLLRSLPHIDPAQLTPWVRQQTQSASSDAVTPDELRLITSLIDLTSLSANDTPESVAALVRRAVSPEADLVRPALLPATAAVCVHADLVGAARVALDDAADAPVALAAVAGGFPHGRSPFAAKAAEVEYAVAAGADEIDIVIDRGALLSERYARVYDWVLAARRLVERGDGTRAHLKVILETGELPSYDSVFHAAIIALLAGADFVKTSTGKGQAGATPEAAAVLLQASAHWREETGETVGVKVSGGVRAVEQARAYLRLARVICGDSFVTPASLRFGASALLDDVLRTLEPLR
ncbi:deoxyribose-phosphate aldolase [Pseudoclavibacter sp. 13-3]|uniref:deoxyribose-phosphate aldolase n=1 Tax=Pseudoclavibacter sp. 13-3 TaxID=2901228 RepID=UPI001E3D3694|nr:deoxyribose-phosphate aldolase [Pseudoclavibacter sp. 13-3]MCD7100984.1 deoxyribose-phosphate aldolase [Pseudoclavibacter sp. 13-3]